jgi:DNA invertase Pin-like site-specific DNA recombinase
MTKTERAPTHSRVPCAIYTRKSSEEGLEQEFNSLDAQREACEAYVLSQRHAGWLALPDMYDDGGISGGTMERAALQRLLEDVRTGRVKVIVVYKVDRLTRSLADFAKIVEVLDAHGASFVSVTQHFNTTTSMGRLTLNVLLSFAQFEREIAGERIRDKIAASKKKGMWMGGNLPLGYDVRDRKLAVNEDEAKTVRHIFQRYAELGSVLALKLELDRDGIVSKRRKDIGGRCAGGVPFTRGALYLLLQNRIYRGAIVHKGEAYAGEHEAIIDECLWNVVATRLAQNRQERQIGNRSEEPSLLAGLLFDAAGERLTPSHAVKGSKRYRYYLSRSLVTERRSKSSRGLRIPAGDLEALVLDRLRQFFASTTDVSAAISAFNLPAATQGDMLKRGTDIASSWSGRTGPEHRRLLTSIVEEVIVCEDHIDLRLKPAEVAVVLGQGDENALLRAFEAASRDQLTLRIEARLKRAGKGVRLIIGAGAAAKPDERLIHLLAQAFDARGKLLSGQWDTVEDVAAHLGLSGTYVTSLIRLTFLNPGIVRAILDGRQPPGLTLTRLMTSSKDLPSDWMEQRRFLGLDDA